MVISVDNRLQQEKGAEVGAEIPIQFLQPFPIFWPALLLTQCLSPGCQTIMPQWQLSLHSHGLYGASSAAAGESTNYLFPLKLYIKHTGHQEFCCKHVRWFIQYECWTPSCHQWVCAMWHTTNTVGLIPCRTSSYLWEPAPREIVSVGLAVHGQHYHLDPEMPLV